MPPHSLPTDKFLYVMMEFCDHGTLADVLLRDGMSISSERPSWTLQLSRGLKHMEILKVIHRDIKPDK